MNISILFPSEFFLSWIQPDVPVIVVIVSSYSHRHTYKRTRAACIELINAIFIAANTAQQRLVFRQNDNELNSIAIAAVCVYYYG